MPRSSACAPYGPRCAVDTPPDAARREASIAAAVAAFERPITASPRRCRSTHRRRAALARPGRGRRGRRGDRGRRGRRRPRWRRWFRRRRVGCRGHRSDRRIRPTTDAAERGRRRRPRSSPRRRSTRTRGGDEELEAPAATESAGTSPKARPTRPTSRRRCRPRPNGCARLASWRSSPAPSRRGDAAARRRDVRRRHVARRGLRTSPTAPRCSSRSYEVAQPHEAIAVRIDGCTVVARAPLP